jgi:transposase
VFIRKCAKTVKGKTYVNHLLVESVSTPNGPRQKVICSLGNLDPGPAEKWVKVARNIENALCGQLEIDADPLAQEIAEKIRVKNCTNKISNEAAGEDARWQTVDTEEFTLEESREAGPVHVGHQMWTKLQLTDVLASAGIDGRTCLLTEAMTINRLVEPSSELATIDWIRRTALPDVLGEEIRVLSPSTLYRAMDRILEHKEKIERDLAEKERNLFNLKETVLLYDLTSSYFEGQSEKNEKAKHGYSRDHRPDCKQVVIGLVVDDEGFPKAHEIYAGNRNDSTTVEEILTAIDRRLGRRQEWHIEATGEVPMVIVDRGMASKENLEQIKARHYHYVVAARYDERDKMLDEFEDESGWTPVTRKVSKGNPFQIKSKIKVKRGQAGEETRILCISEERIDKDKAIRQKQESRLLVDLIKLEKRVREGGLIEVSKVHESIGRLRERYPRVARYYKMTFDQESRLFVWSEDSAKKARAVALDGSYLLKTDREDLSNEEIWKLYSLLTRVEAAFRDLKGPLAERPIFHQIGERVETHIFICVLAYHILAAIEKMFRDRNVFVSWETARKELRTHQIATTVLPAKNGRLLKIRKDTKPEAIHKYIYRLLQIPEKAMWPRRTWTDRDVETDDLGPFERAKLAALAGEEIGRQSSTKDHSGILKWVSIKMELPLQ